MEYVKTAEENLRIEENGNGVKFTLLKLTNEFGFSLLFTTIILVLNSIFSEKQQFFNMLVKKQIL